MLRRENPKGEEEDSGENQRESTGRKGPGTARVRCRRDWDTRERQGRAERRDRPRERPPRDLARRGQRRARPRAPRPLPRLISGRRQRGLIAGALAPPSLRRPLGGRPGSRAGGGAGTAEQGRGVRPCLRTQGAVRPRGLGTVLGTCSFTKLLLLNIICILQRNKSHGNFQRCSCSHNVYVKCILFSLRC